MKISIITINYNDADGLEQTIKSIICQTFRDYEYIVIDGGSTDGSLGVIKKYSEHINYWVSERDKGIYNAMNKGLKYANGDYVNFLNSGDTYYDTNVLDKINDLLNYDIVAGQCRIGKKKMYGFIDHEITMLDLFQDALNHQSTFIRRQLFNKSPYNEQYKLVSDWIFTIEKTIIDNCSFKGIPNIICNYDGNGISSVSNLRLIERENYLKGLLPQRIYIDYSHFIKYKKSPLFNLLEPLSNTKYKFQYLIVKIVHCFLSIYNLFGTKHK